MIDHNDITRGMTLFKNGKVAGAVSWAPSIEWQQFLEWLQGYGDELFELIYGVLGEPSDMQARILDQQREIVELRKARDMLWAIGERLGVGRPLLQKDRLDHNTKVWKAFEELCVKAAGRGKRAR